MEFMTIEQAKGLYGGQPAQPGPQQQQAAGGVGGFVGDIAKNVALTATKLPRVAGTGIGLAIRSLLPQGITEQDLTPEGLAKMMPLLTGKEREGMTKVLGGEFKPGLEQQLRGAAGTASFAIPGAPAGAGIIRTAAQAAPAGAAYTAGQEGTTLPQIAGGAALGAAGAGLFRGGQKLLSKIKPSALRETGEAARRGIVQPQAQKTSPYWAKTEEELAKAARDEGLQGSASQQASQLPGKLKALSDQIKSKLSKNNPVLDRNQVQQQIGDKLDDALRFDPDARAVKADLLNDLNILPKKLTVSDLFKFKQKLGDSLTRAFEREAKGQIPLKPAEEVGIVMYRAINDVIGSSAPHIREMTLRQSKLIDLAPGLYKSAHGPTPFGRLPAIGDVPGAREVIQRGTDWAGRTAIDFGTAGERLGTFASPLKDTFNSAMNLIPAEIRGRLLNNFSAALSGKIVAPEGQGELPPIMGGQQ